MFQKVKTSSDALWRRNISGQSNLTKAASNLWWKSGPVSHFPWVRKVCIINRTSPMLAQWSCVTDRQIDAHAVAKLTAIIHISCISSSLKCNKTTCHNRQHISEKCTLMHMECQRAAPTKRMIDCSECPCYETATDHTTSVHQPNLLQGFATFCFELPLQLLSVVILRF